MDGPEPGLSPALARRLQSLEVKEDRALALARQGHWLRLARVVLEALRAQAPPGDRKRRPC